MAGGSFLRGGSDGSAAMKLKGGFRFWLVVAGILAVAAGAYLTTYLLLPPPDPPLIDEIILVPEN